jgi:biotin carboxyl carrier protein
LEDSGAERRASLTVRYEIEVNGQLREVDVIRRDDRIVVVMGDREWVVDAAQVNSNVLSLLIEEGCDGTAEQAHRHERPAARDNGDKQISSREVAIGQDQVTGQFVFGIRTLPLAVGLNPRRRPGRASHAGSAGNGPQRIVAPMPGKIVRVLGKTGDPVAQRQPVVVIEAMKMENELRATREGTIAEVLVREGQSVEAGTLLAVVNPS